MLIGFKWLVIQCRVRRTTKPWKIKFQRERASGRLKLYDEYAHIHLFLTQKAFCKKKKNTKATSGVHHRNSQSALYTQTSSIN